MLTAVEQGELALLLCLQRQGAARLACVLAAVHKDHCLMPLLQAVCHLHPDAYTRVLLCTLQKGQLSLPTSGLLFAIRKRHGLCT